MQTTYMYEATQDLNIESTISQIQLLGERIKASQRKTMRCIREMGDVLLKSTRHEYTQYPSENKDECLKYASHQLNAVINKCSKITTLSRNLLRAAFWESSKRDCGHTPLGTSRGELEDHHKQAGFMMPLFYDDQSTDLQRFRLAALPNVRRDSDHVYIVPFGNAFKVGVTCDGPQRFEKLKKDLGVDSIHPVLFQEFANARNVETMALNFLRSQGLSLVSTMKEIFIKYPPAYAFIRNLLSGENKIENYQYLDLSFTKAKYQLNQVLVKSNVQLDFDGYRKTRLIEWCGEVVSISHYFFNDMFAFKNPDFDLFQLLYAYQDIGLSEYDLKVRTKLIQNIQLQKDLGRFNDV